jgi:hypothetical protein
MVELFVQIRMVEDVKELIPIAFLEVDVFTRLERIRGQCSRDRRRGARAMARARDDPLRPRILVRSHGASRRGAQDLRIAFANDPRTREWAAEDDELDPVRDALAGELGG